MNRKRTGLLVAAIMVAPAMAAGRDDQLALEQLAEAIRLHPVAFIPAGINEWHGEQSACGLDALKAETLCLMAAEILGGFCFPTVWLGPDDSTAFDPTKYPRGTITIDKAGYHAAAEEILAGIEERGFKVAIYLSGHYPGIVPETARKFNQRGRLKVITISENQVVQGMPAGDHAGAWETSMLMVLRPGLVDLGRLPSLPPATQAAGQVIPPQHEFRQRTELYGIYQLDPRVWANEHYGRQGVEAVIDGLARVVSESLGDPDYGRQRPAITWPKPDPQTQKPEVRYDHLLPYQWMERFEQAPLVYIPLAPTDNSAEFLTAHAMEWARIAGGMVHAPISYGPSASGGHIAMNTEAYATIVSEIVDDLADMDFRVIVLLTSPSLSADACEKIAAIEPPDHQSIVVAGRTAEIGSAVLSARARMIPSDARWRKLDSPWRIDGRDTLYSLSEDIYGPGDTRVYEHELVCSREDCRGSALLDLGHVQNYCELVINDSSPMSDHWPPYRFIITGLLRPGVNRLRVTVKHQLPPTVDYFFHRPALPRLTGPVTLQVWDPPAR